MAQKLFKLETPKTGFKKLMPFNRFHVERVNNLVIIHFGLVNNLGVTIDSLSAGIFQMEIDAQKDSVMGYLGQIGSLGDPPSPWQPQIGSGDILLFNNLGVASNIEIAETLLLNFSMKSAHEIRAAKGGSLVGEPIALLRSTQDLQKHVLRELYPIQNSPAKK